MLEPSILLVDEPLSGLDRVTASEIDDLLYASAKCKTTMMIVTHNTEEARRVADRVAVLDHGNLVAIGGMEELSQNENALVRALVSEGK